VWDRDAGVGRAGPDRVQARHIASTGGLHCIKGDKFAAREAAVQRNGMSRQVQKQRPGALVGWPGSV
jgi:hypothetical protein